MDELRSEHWMERFAEWMRLRNWSQGTIETYRVGGLQFLDYLRSQGLKSLSELSRDLVEGFRLCGEVPAARGRTYLLAGERYTTLNQLVALVAEELGVRPPRLHLPVWPVWTAGLLCEIVCVPLRIEPPLYRRRVDFYTKSRAFDITRARTELGYAPQVDLREGIRRTIAWYRAQGWL